MKFKTITISILTALILLAGCPSADEDSPFSYASGIETAHGTEGQSLAPVWTNLPAGAAVVYSLGGSPQGVSVDDATGIVTVGPAADVRDTAQITVKAAVGGTKEYSASLTVTVTAKDIATVTGFSISVDDQNVPPLQASTFTVTINNTRLTAGTDYDLSIEKDGAAVNGVTIDNSGLVSITATIDADDGGTYNVKATGKNNYIGVKTAVFDLTVEYSIGDTGPAGGKIFYVNTDPAIVDWTYLEAALQDQSAAVQWGGAGTAISTTGTAIGSGKTNTEAIVAELGANGETAYAAKICSDYTVTHNGVEYADWFLPSKDELNELYKQTVTVTAGKGNNYWSSSEVDSTKAWVQYFSNGAQDDFSNKVSGLSVRAVRAF